jgi:glycosyltransferase involved in cell wall biosynthesis
MPKVSIVIPVHNVAAYLDKCIRSTLNQTIKDIEIICIDDASTDNSPQILQMFAKRDERVKVISHPENLTASQARKNGVLASTGETVMFLDGDDALLPHACETAYMAMQKHGVDVLHFGAKVINCGNAQETRIQWNQNKITPHLGRIEGDLVVSCFRDKKFFFTLWNKMFRADLAKKAFSHIQDGKFPRAQDLYAVFILLYSSRSYMGISDVLLHYHFGTGITGRRVYDISSFERYCQASKVADAIHAFVKDMNVEGKYEGIIAEMRRNLLTDTLNQWIGHLDPKDSAAGYDLLAKHWRAEELVSALAEKSVVEPGKFDVRQIACKVRHAKARKTSRPKTPKTIGIFYYRYHSGGVQRVISLLIPLFLQWGFKVILITEEHEPGSEYPLPQDVERVLIPPFVRKKPQDYRSRAEALAQVIRQHKIDVFNSHASSGEEILFDMLLAQSLGCYVVLSRHELAFSSFLNSTTLPIRQLSIFALADRLTCLTRMDEQYFKIMDVPVTYAPNPVPQFTIQPIRTNLVGPVILWVGRLDYVQKQCLEPVEIMHEVVRSVPNAKLLMVGGGWSADAEKKLRDRISALGLHANIELCGYTPNPEKYYSEAACHLMTSSWENYPMVIEESRTFGLPLVMYDMPYLELLNSKKGYVAVEQSDRVAAAGALVHLLENPDLRERIGREAQELVASSDNSLLEDRWKKILSFGPDLENSGHQIDVDQIRMLMESMLHLYGLGVVRKGAELWAAKEEIRKLTSSTLATVVTSKIEAPTIPQPASGQIIAGRTLDALKKRRAQFGSLGALDFLIKRQQSSQ